MSRSLARVSPRPFASLALLALALIVRALATAPALADSGYVPTSTPVLPVELQIPSIGVDASVQYVGTTSDGSMDIPSNFTDVAWYSPGYLPGEPGNAVFDGHVSSTADAAVFFNLQDLSDGANVWVTGVDGTVLQFQVTDVEMYPLDDTPIDTIFGSTGWPQVALITCGGDWNPDVHLFDERTVVYASLVDGGN